MRILRLHALVLAAVLATGVCDAAPLTHAQAVHALEQADAEARLMGIARPAELGRMADADRLIGRLSDSDPQVRALAAAATWQIWNRSGDPAVDKLFARGVEQMQAAALADALETFNAIVKRKPDFAEGWNKRVTVYFLLDRNEESLRARWLASRSRCSAHRSSFRAAPCEGQATRRRSGNTTARFTSTGSASRRRASMHCKPAASSDNFAVSVLTAVSRRVVSARICA